ncbi:peroxidase family protein [Fibrella arboris]|uniref:peroxidase family protein n=1 Tax=Fibrella arboris TaxID=3242486 RepID=UPI0035224FA2
MQPSSENNLDANSPSQQLAHGFKRTLFGFSPSFKKNSRDDNYGYLYPGALTTPFSTENHDSLERLGRSMIDTSSAESPSEFSTIDSGYTYFGQFVDHDLTLDVDSKMETAQDARQLTNYRTPNFDLDALYGDGPAVSPFMYDSERIKFVVGNMSNEFDVPRTPVGTAIIGDPRNNENLFVSQFHMSMLRFHNAVIDQLRTQLPGLRPDELFQRAQTEVRRHYQWVVIHDFLRTIVGADVIRDVLDKGLKYFSHKKYRRFFMPVEFSVAAYRFGHSQIRNQYRFNRNFTNDGFFNAFDFIRGNVPNSWVIDWSGFFSEVGREAANKARKIDTRVALSMSNLPTAPGTPPSSMFAVLSARNLVRGMALQVPCGQAVAKRMRKQPLTEEQLMSSPFANPTPEQGVQHQQVIAVLQANDNLLLKQTPLWYYILKEAEVLQAGNQLGPVGGRIVAEVFVRILVDSKDSIMGKEAVDTNWLPQFGLNGKDPADYKIVDLLRFAGTFAIPSVS